MEVPQVPESSSLRFQVVLPTRWVDGDVQGVLNNAVYSTLLEEGRFAYFSALGLVEEGHFPFLLAHTNICFLSPGSGGRKVQVEMATTHLGSSSFVQAYRIQEADSNGAIAGGAIWCEAQARLVCYEQATGKSCPMSARFRSRIADFEGLAK